MNYTANALGLLAGLGVPLDLGGRRPALPVKKRKCMRDGCENPRDGGRDYCSLECRRLDKDNRFIERYGRKTKII